MSHLIARREMLALSGLAIGAGVSGATESASAQSAPRRDSNPFIYCFNTSTIRGQELGLVDEIEIAAKAGYQAIEPWIREIDEYVKGGGSLADLRKRIADLGLSVESAIGFPEWIVDDDARRAKGLEEARRSMDLVRQIGGTRLASPPAGATDQTDLNLFRAAERYRALLELGAKMDVVPQVELWGFSKSLSRLGEVLFVAAEAQHPQSCLLLDVYHLYKGGSEFAGLALVRGTAMHVLHMNDYPATPKRAEITDADRVYPGDGVAPLKTILRGLADAGFRGALSLELFNKEYWRHDAFTVAKTGLDKTRAVVEDALRG